MKTRLTKEGFTLIELLVVIGIIGILAAIAVPMYLGQRTRAAMSEARTNLEIIRTLEEEYFAENGRYSPNPDGASYYKSGDTSIQTQIPRFKPGDVANLNFEYTITSSNDGLNFIARATGKTGSLVAGSSISLNDANAWGN